MKTYQLKKYSSLLILVCFTVFSNAFAQDEIQVAETRTIALLPFSNNGNAENDWIAVGLEYLVINKISVVSGLTSLDSKKVHSSMNQISFMGGTITEKQANQIGKLINADITVSGTYSDNSEELAFEIEYHNATNGRSLFKEKVRVQSKFLALVADRIVIQLLNISGLPVDENEELITKTSLTKNFKAFKSFILAFIESTNEQPNNKIAEGLFRQAIIEDDQFWEAYYNLGVVLFNTNQYNESIELFNTLISKQPNFYKSYFGRALIYENQKDYEMAISDFKKVIDLNPNEDKAFYHLGKIYIVLRRFDEANENLDTAKLLNSENPDNYYETGNMFIAQNKPGSAIDEYRHAVELEPDNMKFHQGLGEAYYYSRTYYNALYEFESILKVEPNSANANFMLGITIYKQAVLEQIVEAFLDLLDEDLLGAEEKQKLSNKSPVDSIKQAEFFEKIITAFSNAVNARPGFMQANFNLALSYLEIGQYEMAEKYFLETISIAPNLVPAYTKLAEVYEKTNRRQLALKQYKTVFYIDPEIFVEKPTLGRVHHYINVLDIFLDDLDTKRKENPNDIKLDLVMAKVYKARGNNSGAQQVLKNILSRDPSNSEAQAILASLQEVK